MTTSRIRSYTELMQHDTFAERLQYLAVIGSVGDMTFGTERYINQSFYRSAEWRHIRNLVIARDLGRDLGVEGLEIHDRVIIHHMNPMSIDDLTEFNDDILNPEYLITTSHNTHNSIHYGTVDTVRQPYVERRPGDTTLW